jgi:nucleoside transporter
MTNEPRPRSGSVAPRLAAMMFLQFFLWGAWYVTLGPFMNARGMKPEAIGDAYSVGPIAAILAPVFLGMIADRFFASQVVLGVMHLIGGALLLIAPQMVPASGDASYPTAFVALLFAHMLCYMPTLGLSNTVAFHNIRNAEKEFPLIRVLGTIGWIVAGFVVGFLANRAAGPGAAESAINAQPVFFQVAGASGILLGLYSFSLPHTPPPARGKPFSLSDALGLESLKLLKIAPFAVFIVCSFLICIPLAAYYSFAGVYAGATGITNIPVKMSFGQMSEIAFMVVMPLFFARLGVKWMLAVGMLAWAVRYGLFAGAWGGNADASIKWMVLAGIILHGICYDFFFVTGQIYVDKKAPATVRGQAQGFLVLITQGLGMLVGNQVFPKVVNHFTTGPESARVIDWKMVWMVPTVAAAVILFVFITLFRDREVSAARRPSA